MIVKNMKTQRWVGVVCREMLIVTNLQIPFMRTASPSQSPTKDLPQWRRDLVQNFNVFLPLHFSEDDYARFSVNYVGSAALDLQLSPSSIIEARKAFSEEGMAGGQAAVPKNVIHMQVS